MFSIINNDIALKIGGETRKSVEVDVASKHKRTLREIYFFVCHERLNSVGSIKCLLSCICYVDLTKRNLLSYQLYIEWLSMYNQPFSSLYFVFGNNTYFSTDKKYAMQK